MEQTDEPAAGSVQPPDIPGLWCPCTAVGLKQVLHHMEAKHPQRLPGELIL